MNRITVEPPFCSQLDGLDQPVELIDPAGKSLGHFMPRRLPFPGDQCPFSSEELERREREEGGRSLAEIWESLGAN